VTEREGAGKLGWRSTSIRLFSKMQQKTSPDAPNCTAFEGPKATCARPEASAVVNMILPSCSAPKCRSHAGATNSRLTIFWLRCPHEPCPTQCETSLKYESGDETRKAHRGCTLKKDLEKFTPENFTPPALEISSNMCTPTHTAPRHHGTAQRIQQRHGGNLAAGQRTSVVRGVHMWMHN
jgi:hypothetical protein